MTIVSSDKDLMQLVDDGRSIMLDTMKDRRIGVRAEVIEKFGVPPDKVGDVLALMGDSVDNVPGVPGIGPKTAAQLIQEYGDLETVLGARRRDQAGQAPPDADRLRRAGANLQEASSRSTKRSRLRSRSKTSPCTSRTTSISHRLPQSDGIFDADAARRRTVRHRGQRDRGKSRSSRPSDRAAAPPPPHDGGAPGAGVAKPGLPAFGSGDLFAPTPSREARPNPAAA